MSAADSHIENRLPANRDSLDCLVGPCFVRMFKPQFAPLVEAGTKLQTVRPTPKRVPQAGDRISLRAWTGKPYRSKQRVLRESIIEKVEPIRITTAGIYVSERPLGLDTEQRFARADGFRSWVEMREWFENTHGLPFEGIIIYWSNVPHHPRQPEADVDSTQKL